MDGWMCECQCVVVCADCIDRITGDRQWMDVLLSQREIKEIFTHLTNSIAFLSNKQSQTPRLHFLIICCCCFGFMISLCPGSHSACIIPSYHWVGSFQHLKLSYFIKILTFDKYRIMVCEISADLVPVTMTVIRDECLCVFPHVMKINDISPGYQAYRVR